MMIVVVIVMIIMMMVMMMIVAVIVVMPMVMAMVMAMFVAVIMMPVRLDVDIELGCRDAAAVDPLDAGREPGESEKLQLVVEPLAIKSKIEHRADEHIAADAGEAVQIEGSCHNY